MTHNQCQSLRDCLSKKKLYIYVSLNNLPVSKKLSKKKKGGQYREVKKKKKGCSCWSLTCTIINLHPSSVWHVFFFLIFFILISYSSFQGCWTLGFLGSWLCPCINCVLLSLLVIATFSSIDTHAYIVCSFVQHSYRPQYDGHLASVSFQLYAFKRNLHFHDIADMYGTGIDIIVSTKLLSFLFDCHGILSPTWFSLLLYGFHSIQPRYLLYGQTHLPLPQKVRCQGRMPSWMIFGNLEVHVEKGWSIDCQHQ